MGSDNPLSGRKLLEVLHEEGIRKSHYDDGSSGQDILSDAGKGLSDVRVIWKKRCFLMYYWYNLIKPDFRLPNSSKYISHSASEIAPFVKHRQIWQISELMW